MFPFNVRVYGILINTKNEVLVSDEWIRGKKYTKFPGGGLEFGEGTRDCLKREFLEEMRLDVDVTEHLYTTDYFQPSAFDDQHQLISIYYFVNPLAEVQTAALNGYFSNSEEGTNIRQPESFRFICLDDFGEESVSLPVDKIVALLIKHSKKG